MWNCSQKIWTDSELYVSFAFLLYTWMADLLDQILFNRPMQILSFVLTELIFQVLMAIL
jgi:hypothetical protein